MKPRLITLVIATVMASWALGQTIDSTQVRPVPNWLPSGPVTSTSLKTDIDNLRYYIRSPKSVDPGHLHTGTTVMVVAAVDSTVSERATANYVCTGDSDETVINEALAAVATSGGEVRLLAGTYTIDGSIAMPSNTTLRGVGYQTHIQLKPGYGVKTVDTDMVSNTDRTNGNVNVAVYNIRLDGNNDTLGSEELGRTNGFRFERVDGFIISDNWIEHLGNSVTASCMAITPRGSTHGIISGNIIEDVVDGINLANSPSPAPAVYCRWLTVSNNVVRGTNRDYGINVVFVSDSTFTGNVLTNCGHDGIDIGINASNNIIANNVISQCSQWADNTYGGILLMQCGTGNTVMGNVIRSATSGNGHAYGIKIFFGTVGGNRILYNDVVGGGTTELVDEANVDTIWVGNKTTASGTNYVIGEPAATNPFSVSVAGAVAASSLATSGDAVIGGVLQVPYGSAIKIKEAMTGRNILDTTYIEGVGDALRFYAPGNAGDDATPLLQIINAPKTISAINGARIVTGTNPASDADAIAREYVVSRGMNLVTNGSGLMGDAYNFTGGTFYPVDTHGGKGSFRADGQWAKVETSEFIPVDTTRTYRLSHWAKRWDTPAMMYAGVSVFDIDGLAITAQHVNHAGDTTLAAPLKAGDTTFTVVDSTNWNKDAFYGWSSGLGIYKYRNSGGYLYAPYTYTRIASQDSGYDGNCTSDATEPAWPTGTGTFVKDAATAWQEAGPDDGVSPTWQPNTAYWPWAKVRPSVGNGHTYTNVGSQTWLSWSGNTATLWKPLPAAMENLWAVSGADAPAWPTGPGSTVTDNEILWTEGSTGGSTWQSGYNYATGDKVAPGNGHTYTAARIWPIGTPVAQALGGDGNGRYVSCLGQTVPTTWTHYEGTIGPGGDYQHSFPAGTALVKVFATGNYDSAGTTLHSDFWFSEVTANNIEAASATQQGVVTTGTQTFAGTKTFGGIVTGALKVTGGSPSVGKFLGADADGNATWQTPADLGARGSGTPNYLARWTAADTIGDSLIRDDGATVGIGMAPSSDRMVGISRTYGTWDNLSEYGMSVAATYQQGHATQTPTRYGLAVTTTASHTSDLVPYLYGVNSTVTTNGNGGTVTNAKAFRATGTVGQGATVTNYNGINVLTPTKSGSPLGVITNAYGIKIEDYGSAGDTLSYAIYTGTGASRFGGQIVADGGLKIASGATTDYALVSDEFGNATWGWVPAPATAEYLTLAGSTKLSNEYALGGLGTGMLKINGYSNPTLAVSGTDYSAGTAALASGVLKSTTTTGALSTMTGTQNYLTKWTATDTIGDSLIRDDGSTIGIGLAPANDRMVGISRTYGTWDNYSEYGMSIATTYQQGHATQTPTRYGLQVTTTASHTADLVPYLHGIASNLTINGNGGTVSNARAFRTTGTVGSGATVTNYSSINIVAPTKSGNPTPGVITNAYGIKIEDFGSVGDTLSYAIYTGTGTSRFGGQVVADGGLKIATGAVTDYALVSDEFGNATWGWVPAPATAEYITLAGSTKLSNEFAVGGLGTGMLKINGYSSPTLAAAGTDFEGPIAAGTTAQYWRGDKSWQTLDKTAVGLGNVLNVAQAPGGAYYLIVGTNQYLDNAINVAGMGTGLMKLNNAGNPTLAVANTDYLAVNNAAMTGNPTAPTPATGDNDTSVATTAFVKAQGYSTTTGTVTSVSASVPSGFSVNVTNPTTTPDIAVTTSLSGMIKGTGTGFTAATSGTDFSAGTSALATGVLKSTTTTGALSTMTGTQNYLTKWTAADTIGDSLIRDDGTNTGIGVAPDANRFLNVSKTWSQVADVTQYGTYLGTTYQQAPGGSSTKYGLYVETNATHTTGTMPYVYGVNSLVNVQGTGTVTDVRALRAVGAVKDGATVTRYTGVHVVNPQKTGSPTPTIGTLYGLKIESMTSGGTNYAIYTDGGTSRFGGLVQADAGVSATTYKGGSAARGAVTVATSTTYTDVSFGSTYGGAPYVVVTPTERPDGEGVLYWWVSNVTTTGFRINVDTAPNTDGMSFTWMAME